MCLKQRAAILLLLTSGRRVHDLTLLHFDDNHFIVNDDSITLIPTFGSKTDSVTHQQSSWKLLSCPDKNIDPVYWLKTLKTISSVHRNLITNIFITTREPIKPATPTIIGGWIKKLLSEAGIKSSPGSLRSAVSSLNWLENYPINEILEKANWRHENTFRKFYQKNVQPHSGLQISQKSLSQYFSTS
ncbi:hypothetical protein ACJJTC_015276 [Scirpophaga incertulas]